MSTAEAPPSAAGTPLPRPRDWGRVAWRIARAFNVVVLVVLIVGLVLWPGTALRVMWNLLIPVLPASFFIAPQWWRGICPLATLNQWSSGWWGRRQLSGRLLAAANVVGILLLVLLVPARRFFFNENGPLLAATITAVALAALLVGAFFDRRAGFCNGVCPVLPVERLYGQHPLVNLDSRRCDTCTLCIPKGCLELDPTKSFVQAIGPAARRHSWLATTYGAFASALPGFIVGYYTISNGSWTLAPRVYLWIASACAASYGATAVVVWVLRLTRPVALAWLAALSLVLYYWWAAPMIVEMLFLPTSAAPVGRAAAIVLAAGWLVHAGPWLRADRRRSAAS